jgi:2-oxoisovalerate dehydrogenase E2 component (dihydrolipoyl transacylase)
MPERAVKLPDIGEGVAEAELVEWHVKVGDAVREDSILGAVMTDKATVEVPSPVEGEIVWLAGKVGDVVAVGADFVRLKVPGGAASETAKNEETKSAADKSEVTKSEVVKSEIAKGDPAEPAPKLPARHRDATNDDAPRERPLAAPAVRLRAREAGVDLRHIPGSGPAGRITHEDLDAYLAHPQDSRNGRLRQNTQVTEIKIAGLRRKIAEKISLASTHIPHFTYVEEVDVTALEELRGTLNKDATNKPKLTLLPFLMRAMVRAIDAYPQFNARFDDETNVVHQHAGVHIGIATQTPSGLTVPVVRHAEARDLWDSAAELGRLAKAARTGTATRDELTGSTITITSLGALGGLVNTPIINHPEVAIVGVNKIMVRPHWDGEAFVPRKVMNLSSSFDHRIIDGWDAALFVQRIKALLETPALIFIER